MSTEKIMLPENVVLKVSAKPLFEVQDHNGNTFLTHDERSARYASCTHVHCGTEGCIGIARKGFVYCPECRGRLLRERISALPVWDGEYPIFVDEEFIADESELLDYLEENEIQSLATLKICGAVPNMASDIDVCYDDLLAEDCDLPAEVQQVVDEFRAKLKEIKAPMSYISGRDFRLDAETIARYKHELELE